MGGPRVSSGTESAQDYGTPDDFMAAIKKMFGPISFDLAAHSGNKKHPRYFAPKVFVEVGTAEEIGVPNGALKNLPDGVSIKTDSKGKPVKDKKTDLFVYTRTTPNNDPEAYAFDAFSQDWAAISAKFQNEHPSGRALLWDNCEFNDVDPWAEKHWTEMKRGANSLLLTPYATTNWYRDQIAGRADVYPLLGRLCFDGKNVYPKDCMVSHFHPNAKGTINLWDWRHNAIVQSWVLKSR